MLLKFERCDEKVVETVKKTEECGSKEESSKRQILIQFVICRGSQGDRIKFLMGCKDQ